MQIKLYITLVASCIAGTLLSQNYNDYVGAGHNVGMTITASSSEPGAGPEKTMDASGMLSPYFSAGRFLSQATLGFSSEQLDDFYNEYGDDYEGWIDAQQAMPMEPWTTKLDVMWDEIFHDRLDYGQDTFEIFGPYALHFNYLWWQEYMDSPQMLRHRVTQALSQILVISTNSDISDWGEAQAFYYDILQEHAFGNYQDLLTEVTYSLPMGYYLSHYNNTKAIPEEDIRPDENFAREIMQLFTIGLYELNSDGTRVLDANGDPIPTYGQDEIKEMAQVFTGLGPGDIYDGLNWPPAPFFGLDLWAVPKAAHTTARKVEPYTRVYRQSGSSICR